jgi:tetratricopeptide (TPR) repeat protein
MSNGPPQASPDAAAVRRHVDAIVTSEGFARSKRLASFLRWVVERALAGDPESITERNIASEVYGRPRDFDPKVDGTVRAEAIRLRHKLREYYASSSRQERIDIPKGGYVPAFLGFGAAEAVVLDAAAIPQPAKPTSRWRVARGAAVISAIAALALGLMQAGSAPDAPGKLQRARRLAGEAQRLTRMGDNIGAAERARQAVALAPGDAAPHRVLSRALMNLNRDSDAILEARLAESMAPAGSEEAGESTAQRRIAELDVARAVQLYRQLAASHSQSFDLLLYLAQAELRGLQYDAALATLDRARKLPDAASSPELDRLAALALANLAVRRPILLPNALATIHRARDKATALHSKPAMGRVLLLEGGLEANGGLAANSNESLRISRELCGEVHDDQCVAASLRVEGNRQVAGGQYSEALHLYDLALNMALQRQNRLETHNLMEGIEAAMDGLRASHAPRPIPIQLAPDRHATIR